MSPFWETLCLPLYCLQTILIMWSSVKGRSIQGLMNYLEETFPFKKILKKQWPSLGFSIYVVYLSSFVVKTVHI